jgi:hypothetical protein
MRPDLIFASVRGGSETCDECSRLYSFGDPVALAAIRELAPLALFGTKLLSAHLVLRRKCRHPTSKFIKSMKGANVAGGADGVVTLIFNGPQPRGLL